MFVIVIRYESEFILRLLLDLEAAKLPTPIRPIMGYALRNSQLLALRLYHETSYERFYDKSSNQWDICHEYVCVIAKCVYFT